MFPCHADKREVRAGFPRVRGDVPGTPRLIRLRAMFSPRARGCSYPVPAPASALFVFPACAGMFPMREGARKQKACFPRVRGDVPQRSWRTAHNPLFSPRARGCSGSSAANDSFSSVFPACAGMFLRTFSVAFGAGGFPRVRGDVPAPATPGYPNGWFSPRARGCSPPWVTGGGAHHVFPACAGMFLWGSAGCGRTPSFPRVRGDVP